MKHKNRAVFQPFRTCTLYECWCVHWQTQLENQCDIPLFMLMVLTVSTNRIRKGLCHCAVIEIMQILARQNFVITTLIHKFPFYYLFTLRHALFYHLRGIHYFLSLPYTAFIVSRCKQKDMVKKKGILLNNEQGNKVNSQRSFSCISVDFSGEDQQALFLSFPIRSTSALQ